MGCGRPLGRAVGFGCWGRSRLAQNPRFPTCLTPCDARADSGGPQLACHCVHIRFPGPLVPGELGEGGFPPGCNLVIFFVGLCGLADSACSARSPGSVARLPPAAGSSCCVLADPFPHTLAKTVARSSAVLRVGVSSAALTGLPSLTPLRTRAIYTQEQTSRTAVICCCSSPLNLVCSLLT